MTENMLYDDGATNLIPDLSMSINGEDTTNGVVVSEYTGQGPTVSLPGKKIRDSVVWTINGVVNGMIRNCVNVGDYEISATVTRTGYDPTTITGTLRITPKPLSVTGTSASDKIYDGTTEATIFRGYVSGFVDASSVICSASGSFPDAEVGDYDIPVTFSLWSTDPELVDNYIVPDPVEVSASILPKQLTLPEPTASDKMFDGSDEAAITIGELVGVIAGDDVSVSATGYFEDAEPGTDKPVTVDYMLTGSDAGNYTIERGQTTASITEDPTAVSVSWSGIKYKSRKVE